MRFLADVAAVFAGAIVSFFTAMARGIVYAAVGAVAWGLGIVCVGMLLVAVWCFVGGALTHSTGQLGTGVAYLVYAAVAYALIVVVWFVLLRLKPRDVSMEHVARLVLAHGR